MFRKITAIAILVLGVLVIVLGLCFQGAESSSVNDYLLYAGNNSDMSQIAMAFSPLTNAQKQLQQTLVNVCRLVTAAIGTGILALGLAKLAEAFSSPAAPRPAAKTAPAAPAPAAAIPKEGVQIFDDSLPDL